MDTSTSSAEGDGTSLVCGEHRGHRRWLKTFGCGWLPLEITEEHVMFARGRVWLGPVCQTCCVFPLRGEYMCVVLDIWSIVLMSCHARTRPVRRRRRGASVHPRSYFPICPSSIPPLRPVVQSQLTRCQVDPAGSPSVRTSRWRTDGRAETISICPAESPTRLSRSSPRACGYRETNWSATRRQKKPVVSLAAVVGRCGEIPTLSK